MAYTEKAERILKEALELSADEAERMFTQKSREEIHAGQA